MKAEKKRKKPLSAAEKALIAVIAGLILLIALAWILLGEFLNRKPEGKAPLPPAAPAALATPEDRLPRHLAMGQSAPEAVLTDESGAKASVKELAKTGERGIWLVFWASWCPDCDRQLDIIRSMEAIAEKAGYRLILADRLNREKESPEAAREKLGRYGASAQVVWDEGEKTYQAWGLREIPSSVVLSRDGTVVEYASGVLTEGECRGLLMSAAEGRDGPGLRFITGKLSNGRGGIYSGTNPGGSPPSGKDVLSESQGLMLLYALEKDDRELFDRTWGFIRDSMMTDGLTAWYVREDGTRANVNATLDDLRILQALREAQRKWNGDSWGEAAAGMAQALLEKCVRPGGGLVDFAEITGPGRAETISLCYLAPAVLRELADVDAAFSPAADEAERILQSGRISEAFPLYYARYDYGKGTYSTEDLNTAEALYTLWNLSRAGMLPEEAWSWLRARIEEGALGARYYTDGSVVKGYEYHSTAVWGLAALIAREQGDAQAFETALRRMNRMLVRDAGEERFGAYGSGGTEIYAFDQLIPLLVNARIMDGRNGAE